MKRLTNLRQAATAGAALMFLTSAALAEDTLTVAAAQRGAWESAIPELGQEAGIFKKHGLLLEVTYAQDAGQTEQRVISAAIDVGLDVGAMDAMRAYVRGAPVRIIGADTTGDPQYWYVLASSPIQTVKDFAGKTIAYATNGSSSHYNAFDLMKQFRVKAKLVPTGSPASTLEQVLANRVDIGWAAPPFGLDQIEQGKIRVVARANDVAAVRDKTVTVLIANTDTLQKRKDAISRFMQAYRETVEWMYADPAAVKRFAVLAGLSEKVAQRLRDEFFTKEMLAPDQIVGLKAIIKDAIQSRHIQTSLSRRQRAELIQIPAPPSSASQNCWVFRVGCSVVPGAAASP
jgi:NitT/TauT family transport system substrate-binding protein